MMYVSDSRAVRDAAELHFTVARCGHSNPLSRHRAFLAAAIGDNHDPPWLFASAARANARPAGLRAPPVHSAPAEIAVTTHLVLGGASASPWRPSRKTPASTFNGDAHDASAQGYFQATSQCRRRSRI